MPTFKEISSINYERCKRWHEDGDDWTGADWSNAMCGEAGEVANVVKKIRRVETGLFGSKDKPHDELMIQLGHEIADTFLYLDLLATYYGIDIEANIVEKFNMVSDREGFSEKL